MSALDQHFIDTGHTGGTEVELGDGTTWVEWCPQCDGPRTRLTNRGQWVAAFLVVVVVYGLAMLAGIDLDETAVPR